MSTLIPPPPDLEIQQVNFDWAHGQVTVTYVLASDQSQFVSEVKTLVIDAECPQLQGGLAEVVEILTAYIDAALVVKRNPPPTIPRR